MECKKMYINRFLIKSYPKLVDEVELILNNIPLNVIKQLYISISEISVYPNNELFQNSGLVSVKSSTHF